MSDPVTNVEIEDVLSSIRRLVSEDARARPIPKPARQPERLVLTPALRVKDDEDEDAEPDASRRVMTRDAATGAGPVLLTDPTLSSTPDMPPAGREDSAGEATAPAAVPLTEAGEREPEVEQYLPAESPVEGDETDDTDPEWVLETDPGPVAQVTPGADDASPADDKARTADSVLSRLVQQEIGHALRTADASDVPCVGTEEPSTKASEPAPDDLHAHPEQEAGPSVVTEPSDDTDLLPWDGLGSENQDATPGQTELERKIAALEAMVGGTSDEWDDEAPESGGNAAFVHRPLDVLDWQDAEAGPYVPAAEPDEPLHAPQRASPHARDTEAWYGDEAATIDEDMLRDMVAEIVRQELQGALGERITRNVRKLVRREIHRVLMSQEFD